MPTGAKPTPAARLAAAIADIDRGMLPLEAAEQHGIAKSVIYRELKGRRDAGTAERAPETGPPGPGTLPDLDALDPEADLLVYTRLWLAHLDRWIDGLEPTSPRRNPAEALRLKLINTIKGLEKDRAAVETPEQIAERKRRADGSTVTEIERYVVAAEKAAAEPREGAPHGVCIHCCRPLDG